MPADVKISRLPLLVLLGFAVLCGAWLLFLDPQAHFTTDVTELLPADERDPEARIALSLVRERQARVVLITLDIPAGTPAPSREATQAYVDTLLLSNAFSNAYTLADQTWQHELGGILFQHRFELLLPDWLAAQRLAYASSAPPQDFPAWLAARTTAALDAHLASPASAATGDILPADPLLLLPALADRAAPLLSPSSTSRLNSSARASALIWAVTRAGPLTEEGQQPVFAALAAAESVARSRHPGLTARFTGIARFAAAAKASTRAEIGRLNFLALAAVLAIAALCVRRVLGLLHLLPVVLLSTLGAVATTTAFFPRVHVLVLVLGSLLCGVAVDYAFHLILARRENESFRTRVRRLALPLLGGAGTTVAGFLILVFSELPLVRQLGVYVASGIVTGLGVTLLYFSLFPRFDLAPRNWRPRLTLPSRLRAPLFTTLAVFAVFGLTRIRWQDDLRSLEFPAPGLRAEDAAIRSAFGETTTGATFLTRGQSFAEARNRWELFSTATPAATPLSSLATLVPLPADYSAANSSASRDELARFALAFTAASEKAGFEPAAFEPFQRDFSAFLARPAPPYEKLLRETLDTLPGPPGLLVHADAEAVWFLSNAPAPFPVPAAAEGTFSLSAIEGLNHLFSRYRIATGQLSLFGILALVLMSCLLHGPRLGLRIAALPLLATALAFGLLALRGELFGLFHLLGALLGVCLADDYAHFAHADDGSPHARASIRLSGFTTAASFAALTLSSIPAIASLGAAVALIVFFALVFVETDLFSLRRHL